ncbi:Na+/H+ antiporter NhaA [Rhodococcus sovatensis]|uniref:Na(+)/H(+) antiporter NhaA n=1 Tax=Rhodococcus sovatensis TaxID=1805840 RepID=A0ABZ2PLD9_9NOCA
MTIPMQTRLRRIAASESSSAIALLAATLLAIAWANSSPESYDHFWHTYIGIDVGSVGLEMSLQHWVNDAVMVLFFFLVTLEVKKDFVLGDLRDWHQASLPVVAALCGLAVPAVIFVLITAGTPDVGAWGVVISTDTAFVVGILAAFGSRLPVQLRVFLLTLAVVDDVGALIVIAIVYTDSLDVAWLAVAVGVSTVVYLVQRFRVWRGAVYGVLGVILWFAILQSGIHATIAGVVLALLLPVFPPKRDRVDRAETLTQGFRRTPNAEKGRAAAEGILSAVSVNDRFQLSFHRIVGFVVVPVFALANAGVVITSESLQHAFSSTLTWGVIIGLVVGKFIGVTASALLGRIVGVGELPPALHARHIASGSLLTGIGFTISLFIVDLAIDDPVAQSDARIGIITASLVAALAAIVALWCTARFDAAHAPGRIELVRRIDPRRDHVVGPDDAVYTLVEYGSFGSLDDLGTQEILDEVIAEFEGDIMFVFRHIRPDAAGAPEQTAEALEVVASQSPRLFWSMRRDLNRISEESALDVRSLLRATVNVGANLSRMENDLRRGARRARVQEDFLDAESMGLTKGPVLFVNGVIYTGPMEADAVIAELRATLPAARAAGVTRPIGKETVDNERARTQ